MWPLAVFGPVGIAAAIVGTVGVAAYNAFSDDDDETVTYNDESEVVEATRTEKRDKILKEIEAYKRKQIKRFKDKYDVEIKFNSDKSKNSHWIGAIALNPLFAPMSVYALGKLLFEDNDPSKIILSDKKDVVDSISALEDETEEIIKLIGELEVEKHATNN